MGGTTLLDELEAAARDTSVAADALASRGDAVGARIAFRHAAALSARAARIRESLDSITRAAGTPQNRAVKDWLLDLTGPLSPTVPAGPEK